MRYGGHALAEAGTIVSYRPDAATGDLAPEIYPTYPPYVWSSVGLNTSLSDLTVWAGALVRGDLVPRRTLLDHWQPLPLSNGRPGAYADGWEYSDLGDFITVGHGGGNRVNFMHGFRKSIPSDTVTVIYLDNGGPREIPTRRITTVLADALIPGFASPTQLLFEDLGHRPCRTGLAGGAGPAGRPYRRPTPVSGRGRRAPEHRRLHPVRDLRPRGGAGRLPSQCRAPSPVRQSARQPGRDPADARRPCRCPRTLPPRPGAEPGRHPRRHHCRRP